ncbi:COP1-interacting protein 7 [Gastrolobium bilobum]|uniref:COP1-interacting protein 7 n=1 Tax=Gastrolobium bilobum TaxID=150636 RepID=UPI002AB04D3D|nr:COP1-interacting protein 7 [Gastrolobium bilobum]
MDPSSRLDHVLFQLTPTRTRCDLVIVAGGVSERLASGLLEPFLTHLKSAKDQISKGGYSITLSPAGAHAPWFTKATLQRFVRFISTPEVLERFVTIEKEIVQIEGSIQSNEKSNLVAEAEGNVSYADGRVKRSTTSSKMKDELAGTNQDGYEENSRVRLQRVLDNRKAMLCKEQAMAYARALVAGFYPESVDDLIYFADAFGASRLREACINFLELCKQKNEDKLWIDEIAAMQASAQPELPYLRTSGIILAGEDDASSKINGLVDASISESTASHASLEIGQDYNLPTSAQTPSTDGRAQIPMSWPNHLPQYYHNFQGHAFQQMPPYQGYLYPGMQVPSSFYPGNMQWPPNGEDSHIVHDREMDYHKSSFKKKKKHSQIPEHPEEDGSTASSDSSYESDSDDHSRQSKKHSSTEHLHKKKHGKKSSRKVVIRNINYITSNGDGEKGSITEGSLSNEEEFINGESLKEQVEEAVVSLERRHKSSSRRHKKQQNAKHPGMLNGSADADSNGIKGNNNWDAFQNLLLRDDDSTLDTEKQTMKLQEEYIVNRNFEDGRSNEFNQKPDITKTRVVSNDSFVVTERELDNEGRSRVEYFKEGKDAPSYMKKINSTDEELLFSRRNDESGSYSVSGCGLESSLTKCKKEEDWFIINQSDKLANEDGNRNFSMFDGVSISSSATDSFHVEKNKKDILADDSFMIQARSSQEQFNSQSAADISLVSDIVGVTEFANSIQEGSRNKTETLKSHEPDDLFMVLDRDSAVEQNAASWSVEMDYENNISLSEANRKVSDTETDNNHLSNQEGNDTKTPGGRTGKVSSKEARSKALNASLGKSKSDIMTRSKASPGSRSTVLKSKSEKEEETRKRKEELLILRQKRIAERSASKKSGTETKTSLTTSKKEKPKIPSTEETKKLHKPVLRNSTIERLATARVSQKVSPSQAKSTPTKKPSLKANGVPLQKTTGTEKKKQVPKEDKSSNQKEDAKKTNGEVLSDTNALAKNEMEASVVLPVNSGTVQSVEPSKNSLGLKENGELSKTSSEEHARYLISESEQVHENVGQLHMDSSLPNHDHTLGGNLLRGEELLDKLSSLPGDNKPQHIDGMIINPTAGSPIKPLTVSTVNSKVNHEIDESDVVLPKVSEKQISTPPPSDQVIMLEPNHSRKKWNSDEDSSKAAKGFRKLLFFGRKS